MRKTTAFYKRNILTPLGWGFVVITTLIITGSMLGLVHF